MKFCLSLLVFLCLAGFAPDAAAQPVVRATASAIEVCDGPATASLSVPTVTSCRPAAAAGPNPQGTMVWVRILITLPEPLLTTDRPLGLFLSGKASSEVYLNGSFLGRNGTPGNSRAEESVGRMDAVLHIPDQLVHQGENILLIRMSAHHSWINLAHPLHMIAVGYYADPQEFFLHHYLPAFLPLGVLLAGALYFGLAALRHRTGWHRLLVPLVALFASGQLVAEVSRGIFAYSYPFQDIRLVLVLVCATATGLCLLLHIIDRFVPKRRAPVALAAILVTLGSMIVVDGFDGKSAFAILVPAVIGFGLACLAAFRREPRSIAYAVALGLFASALVFAPIRFMDVYLYYIIAGLLLFLFIDQIRILTRTRELQRQQRERANRLAIALAEAEQKQAPSTLSVTSGGRVERVPTDQLIYCKGARDYVELVIDGSKSKLHSASLTELAEELPATFLRVHRSYIVNTGFIDRLERETSGSGTLHMTTGDKVPVSRRIMPTVRKALT